MISDYLLELQWRRYRDLNYLSKNDIIEFTKLNEMMKKRKLGIFK